MEVYVDDLFIKSKFVQHHLQHLVELFAMLRHYWLNLTLLNVPLGSLVALSKAFDIPMWNRS